VSLKTVVIVAPDFPPSSLPPSVRMRLFTSHLAEFNWQPIVITTHPDYYDTPLDADNLKLLPPQLEIIRTRALPLPIARRFGFGDLGMRSLWYHWRALRSLCAARRVDLVFISVPPYYTMLLGRMAFQRFRIPYVIDYQDPWVNDYYWSLPRSRRPPKWWLTDALSRILEPLAICRAEHLTAVSQGTLDRLMPDSPGRRIETSVIPFGFEPGDFKYLKSHRRANLVFQKDDGFLHISYVGAYAVAMESTLRAVFQAIGCLRHSRLRLHFVGTTYSGGPALRVLPIAQQCGLGDIVTESPERVPWLDSLQLMLDSHLLLIIGSEEAHYMSSKVFPYLLSNRPVLAVVHEQSDVVGILQGIERARTVTFNGASRAASRVGEIVSGVRELLDGTLQSSDIDKVALSPELTARSMAERLANAFDRVLSRSRA
jgi:hypothetical protein